MDVIETIKKLRTDISLLKQYKSKGIAPYSGFTVSIGFGGNKPTDVENITVGSVSDGKGKNEVFLNLIIDSIENNLNYWEKVARNELDKLTELLESNNK